MEEGKMKAEDFHMCLLHGLACEANRLVETLILPKGVKDLVYTKLGEALIPAITQLSEFLIAKGDIVWDEVSLEHFIKLMREDTARYQKRMPDTSPEWFKELGLEEKA